MRVYKAITILWICIVLCGCGSQPKEYVEGLTLAQENVYFFEDGTTVDLWRMESIGRDVYMLSDGTILLKVADYIPPIALGADGVKIYSSLDLSENVQEAVLVYFEKQGLLYDVQSELEKAYTYYLSCKQEGIAFNSFYVSQERSFVCENSNIVCFDTTVIRVRENREAQDIELSDIFDKRTGERLNIWDLFLYPQSESKNRLVDAIKMDDEALLTEMEKALEDEFIHPSSRGLVITFPEGTLKSLDASFNIEIAYDDLRGILHSWAIPYPKDKFK
ncbi:hypothetical protein [Anaerotignum propionicum]|uniref:hypothetical protein n=1 Tax=Anaerotignum propionicum TaxID=28446 RepID=UPI00210940AA|nr:hypothetical protein [Anaerotignum propionicum]MCQ4935851.1 hypothetical protein [Anaerotignum propionicum]